MGWDFDYSLAVGRGASGGTSLSTLGEVIRLNPETGPGRRPNAQVVPFREGDVGDVSKYYSNWDLPVEVQLYDHNGSGAVTHMNGRPGHIYENWHDLIALLGGQDSELWFGRNDPHAGRVEIPVELLSPMQSSNPRRRQVLQLRTRWPFWSEETQRTSLTDFTLAGDAPVSDLQMTITSGTDVKVTNNQTGDYVQIAGATPGGGILIDCGLRRATYVTGGANAEPVVSRNAAHWFRIWPGTVSWSITGGGSIAISLYEQYR